MYYFTGDGRLCAFVMISSDQQVAFGVPKTDDDVTSLAYFNLMLSFDLIFSIYGLILYLIVRGNYNEIRSNEIIKRE